MNEFIYKVFDTVEKCYWQTEKAKSFWNSEGAAKSAWTDKQPWRERVHADYPYFNTQSRFVIHRFKLVFDKEL